MRKAGWHADTLNAPGKFLISAPGHDTPRRARACLITDDDVRDAVARCTPARPELDPVSSGALSAGLRTQPRTHSESGSPEARSEPGTADARYDPDVILRRALSAAPAEGIPVGRLIAATGMSRRWVFYRLRQLAAQGYAVQTVRGYWRAA